MSAQTLPVADNPTSSRKLMRLAGAFYLVIILAGVGGELALRAPLLSAAAPAPAIAANLAQFRASLGADIIMILADIGLALAFFTLLRPVSETAARAALVFRLMQAAMITVGVIFLAAVPALITAGEPALALQLAGQHAIAYDTGLIFFGVNSMIMAWLLCHGTQAPTLLNAGIGLSGIVYVAGGLTRLLAPELVHVLQPAYLLPLVAESWLCLWLLFTRKA
ncbi:DUF4386 domain-containing protein [Mesobacterium sp. TK19101]|uniref:DUF4386 domain-containing protein n=1 Tax=Mesobacterium hydrothermale TaxID=3111907 RepID=A0ABU6HC14_9RHOB|nr:DUF4386 domain-containing protein [Mesobacterium sp. TK19101]MEC3859995.1 DUF4386 domain-containing protein [Mesobacterium sp. TK19101]